MKKYYRVLTIAGSDSGGGAGIQADLKTFSALGCYGMSVITALTAQNTVEVKGIFPVSPNFIEQQLDAVFEDIGVDAVKIGMLHSEEVIKKVSLALRLHKAKNIVLDPVMVSKSGDRLIEEEAVEALRTRLLPLATVTTPNLPEAGVLLNKPVNVFSQMEEAAKEIAAMGPKAVMLKGGHLNDEESTDILYIKSNNSTQRFTHHRVDSPNTHGTGCTLSSAIAAGLAKKLEFTEAVKQAKDYISKAIETGADYKLGNGHGPVHHFHTFWE